MTHSILFAFVTAVIMCLLFLRDVPVASRVGLLRIGLLFLVTASHGVLDAMTNGGYGIAFFSPFDTTRYFLPFTPVVVSPIGVKSFFSDWGMRVILSELAWIALPCCVLLFSHFVFCRIRQK